MRQYHHKRDELWVVLDRGARVELDGEVLYPEVEEKLFIPRETVHRFSSVGEGQMRILEISFGEFDEDDIVRLDDVYGREYNVGLLCGRSSASERCYAGSVLQGGVYSAHM